MGVRVGIHVADAPGEDVQEPEGALTFEPPAGGVDLLYGSREEEPVRRTGGGVQGIVLAEPTAGPIIDYNLLHTYLPNFYILLLRRVNDPSRPPRGRVRARWPLARCPRHVFPRALCSCRFYPRAASVRADPLAAGLLSDL